MTGTLSQGKETKDRIEEIISKNDSGQEQGTGELYASLGKIFSEKGRGAGGVLSIWTLRDEVPRLLLG